MVLFMELESSYRQARQRIDAKTCEQLLLGVAEVESDAFERLYRLTARSVYAYALSLTRNSSDAQDAMMDTYLAIRSHSDRYVPQGKPMAWILTIARNAVRMQRRSTAREAPLEDIPEIQMTVHSDPDAALVLQEALRILSEQEREIVLLHAGSGLKHREIAAALSLPLSTVLSKYNRAIGKLRKQLNAAGEERTSCEKI